MALNTLVDTSYYDETAITRDEYYEIIDSREREKVPEGQSKSNTENTGNQNVPDPDPIQEVASIVYDVRRQAWRDKAACRDLTPSEYELFFAYTFKKPPGNRDEKKQREIDEEVQRREQEAKQICGRCAVREQCLNDALLYQTRHEPDEIILGGLTTSERKLLLEDENS